jgi:hypothetical protein
MILARASLYYDCSFIVLATVITIVNYNHKTFIVQATGDMKPRNLDLYQKHKEHFFAVFLSWCQWQWLDSNP